MSRYRNSSTGHIHKLENGRWRLSSNWNVYYPNNRLRFPRGRSSITTDKYRVRAFAKKYGLDISMYPELRVRGEESPPNWMTIRIREEFHG